MWGQACGVRRVGSGAGHMRGRLHLQQLGGQRKRVLAVDLVGVGGGAGLEGDVADREHGGEQAEHLLLIALGEAEHLELVADGRPLDGVVDAVGERRALGVRVR